MRIEAGKYYRTRDGRKVGPMIIGCLIAKTPDDSEYTCVYENTGRGNGLDGEDWEGDIVSEWTDSPVRTETVTKRRIVPGVYGRLRVGEVVNVPDCARPDVPPRVEVDIELTGGYGMTATELDDLAMVASQLAEALRDA